MVFTKTAAEVFAQTTAGGAPRGADMGEVRTWGEEIERLSNLAFTNGKVFATRAALYLDLVPAANTPALVIGDPTAGYDGLYMKVGATTTGSWTRLGDVPGYSFIRATDAGAGTANAIVATSATFPSANGGALISLNIFRTNTASPVTVRFNGGAVLTIKTSSGNDIAVGGLAAGMVVAGYKSGSAFRLLSDQASAAIVAAAEAAKAAAETARDVAVGAASSVVPSKFNTQAIAAAYNISALTDFIEVAGNVYQRVTANHPRLGPELSINGNFSSATGWLEAGDTNVFSIGSNILTAVAGSGATIYQARALEAGERIFIKFDVLTRTAGTIGAVLTGSNTTDAGHTTTGTKTAILTATGLTTGIGLNSSGTFVGTLDNFSAKKLPADAFQSADGAWWAMLRSAYTAEPIVLFATGQSNMARTALYASTYPSNLYIWNGSPDTPGTAFIAPDATRVSVSWIYAAEISKANPDRLVYVVNVSKANLGLVEWTPSWSGTNMMGAIDTNVTAALAAIGVSKISSMLFWQGENDAAAPAGYGDMFDGIMAVLRTKTWFEPATPVAVFGIVPTVVNGNAWADAMSVVLEGVASRDRGRRTFIPTRTLSTGYWIDSLHLTEAGIVQAGKMAYNIMSGVAGNVSSTNNGTIYLGVETAVKVAPPMLIGSVNFTSSNVLANASFDFNVNVGTRSRDSLGSLATATTGVLSGTTGTSGRINYSVGSDGLLYIENRLAGAQTIAITWNGSRG